MYPGREAGDGADGTEPVMRLPMDAMVTGRLLPAARFICMPVPSQDMEDGELLFIQGFGFKQSCKNR